MSVDKRKFKNRLRPSQITWACLGGVGREGLRFPLIMPPKGECSWTKRILTPFVAFKRVQTLNQLFDNILYASLTRDLFLQPVFKTFTDTHITIHNEIHTLSKGSRLDRHPPPLLLRNVQNIRVCMGEKQLFLSGAHRQSVKYIRMWKDLNKNLLTSLKLCISPSFPCGFRTDVWPFDYRRKARKTNLCNAGCEEAKA